MCAQIETLIYWHQCVPMCNTVNTFREVKVAQIKEIIYESEIFTLCPLSVIDNLSVKNKTERERKFNSNEAHCVCNPTWSFPLV